MVINNVKGAVYARYKDIADLANALGWSRQKLSPIVNGKKRAEFERCSGDGEGDGNGCDSARFIFFRVEVTEL